jgi:gamma-glutamylcyclotransferase (GGCT)/AIG2-like uncharacterized protein YtfP
MLRAVEAESSGTADWYIFVHGPHRRGASLGYQLADVHLYCGKSLIHGKLWQAGSQALLVREPGGDGPWVLGNIYRVDEDRIRMIDDYHGIPPGGTMAGDFRRVEAEVQPFAGAGASMKAWIWEWTGPTEGAVAVPSGDWTDVERPRQAPILTRLAGVCLLAVPLCIALGSVSGSEKVAMMFGVVGLSALPVAAFACYFAGRRRERRSGVRVVLWIIFGLMLGLMGLLVVFAASYFYA